MLRVGSWLYGKKPANASTQSLDSLSEVKDCKYRRARIYCHGADRSWGTKLVKCMLTVLSGDP